MVGNSKAMREIFGLIEQIAPSNVHVLITGESGTGKELVARTLHDLSPRKAKPFVGVNCAAIPETLIESEIFGHEKGAFTGAAERRAGCFELAAGGTLLLDEIGEMPPVLRQNCSASSKNGSSAAGARNEQDVDVRVLAATNRDPNTAVAEATCAPISSTASTSSHPHAAAPRSHGRPARHGRSHARPDESETQSPRLRRGPSMLDRMMAYNCPATRANCATPLNAR